MELIARRTWIGSLVTAFIAAPALCLRRATPDPRWEIDAELALEPGYQGSYLATGRRWYRVAGRVVGLDEFIPVYVAALRLYGHPETRIRDEEADLRKLDPLTVLQREPSAPDYVLDRHGFSGRPWWRLAGDVFSKDASGQWAFAAPDGAVASYNADGRWVFTSPGGRA